jgi:hypothetical protein
MATPSIIHFYKNVKGVTNKPLAVEGAPTPSVKRMYAIESQCVIRFYYIQRRLQKTHRSRSPLFNALRYSS